MRGSVGGGGGSAEGEDDDEERGGGTCVKYTKQDFGTDGKPFVVGCYRRHEIDFYKTESQHQQKT